MGLQGLWFFSHLAQEIDSKKKNEKKAKRKGAKTTFICVFLSWLLYFTVPGVTQFLYENFHLLLKLGISKILAFQLSSRPVRVSNLNI